MTATDAIPRSRRHALQLSPTRSCRQKPFEHECDRADRRIRTRVIGRIRSSGRGDRDDTCCGMWMSVRAVPVQRRPRRGLEHFSLGVSAYANSCVQRRSFPASATGQGVLRRRTRGV